MVPARMESRERTPSGRRREPSARAAAALVVAALLSAAAGPASRLQAQSVSAAIANPRIRESIDAGWRYYEGSPPAAELPATADSTWRPVTLPHTWNAQDPFDDVEGYRRDVSWYRKHLAVDSTLRGKRLFLYFEGANQVATVFVNGTRVGEHRGGYTAFAFDVTSQLHAGGDNVIAVRVDNSHSPSIPPLSVGYALYGGIYRDVWLLATEPVHFDLTDHASSGVVVTTPAVSHASATTAVRGHVVNESPAQRSVNVVSTIFDHSGARLAQTAFALVLPAGGASDFSLALPAIARPRLWSPEDPYLYTVRTEVRDGDTLLDRIDTPLGFRWYRFTADSGFFLNGARYALHGTNRHQDKAGIGSALSDDEHVRDMQWIKEMGANFVRLAHYPQDPAVLDAADRLGLLIWEEVPVVNYITVSPEFTATSEDMLRDMIRQHRNHPAVVMWGIMNEVFLWSEQGARIGTQKDTAYMRHVRDFAVAMDSVAHGEDPTRPTTMATHASADYDRAGVSTITDVLGVNMYSGWYGGKFADFGTAIDNRHKRSPKTVFFISEYGAEDDWRVNSLDPERFDFSGRWVLRFHESYLRQIEARPWLAGSAIWNEFDFSQPETGGSIPHMNQKGMLTWDRQPKDVFFLYKANWNPEPMVYVATRGWLQREGTDATAKPGAGKRAVPQPVDVYSNLAQVELFANGVSLGRKRPDDVRHAEWQVPFVDGDNVLEARGTRNGKPVTDRVVVHFTYRAPTLADASVPFRQLAVNAGGKAQVSDDDGVVWEGDQPYSAGSFGYVGGEAKQFNKDLAIEGTREPPMYFTYREGIKAYRFDVPDGEYEVELRFAEPKAKAGERVFGVRVNGRVLASAIDLAKDYGLARAAVIRVNASAIDGKGIVVEFTPIAGAPILNAIRVSHE
jgi:beta-galactosidase